VRADSAGPQEHRQRRPRRACRPIVVVDPMPPAGGAQVLSQQLAGLRPDQSHVQVVPLHLDALADPAGRRAVVRRLDFNAAVEVDGPLSVAVVPKRFEGQRAQRGLLFGKHDRDLPLRGAVDARVGPARLPAVQVRLGLLDRLEAQTAERGLLRMNDDMRQTIGSGSGILRPVLNGPGSATAVFSVQNGGSLLHREWPQACIALVDSTG